MRSLILLIVVFTLSEASFAKTCSGLVDCVITKNNSFLKDKCHPTSDDLKLCLNHQFFKIQRDYKVELELCHDGLYRQPRPIQNSKLFMNCLKRNLHLMSQYESKYLN